jgi:Glycosyltransferase like family 2
VSGTGVVVLGMHRSGTSAVTRTVNLLGVPTCVPHDLMRDRTANVRGHWESLTLVEQNERLLKAAGSDWWCPPPLDTDWSAVAGERQADAVARFNRVHPTPSWVCKDPRTCLTAPFWQATLPQRLIYVLALRHPLAVAASLTARDAFTTAAGVALWEGYMARAARAAAGSPAIVCSYEAMVARPRRWAHELHGFLAAQGVELDGRGGPALAAHSVQEEMTHHHAVRTAGGLSDEQDALLDELSSRAGPHKRFEPVLPPVTARTERLFAEGRRLLLPPEERASVAAAPPSGIQLQHRRPRRAPALPPISVVVAPRFRSAPVGETLRALAATAPASAEMVAVGDPRAPLDARVSVVERPAGGGRVAAIAAGLARTCGEIVVICDGGIVPDPGWPQALTAALKRSDAGAAAPALRYRAGNAVYGLTFREACLNLAWITSAPGADPFPVAVVPAAMMALRREVLDAVGSFDAGMSAAGGEDTELCVRLWRAGCLCLAVPRATATMRFDGAGRQPPNPTDFLHNRLRLGVLHLSPPRLGRFLESFRRGADFPEAFARVLAGDVGERRALVDAISCFDDAWLLRRFGVTALEDDNDPTDRRAHELVRPSDR